MITMDIISMQLANKVLKRMNKEYNGIYETFVAINGQTSFITTKDFNVNDHTLKVFVDGALAVQDQDYTKSIGNTVIFNKPLEAGNIVLFTTEVTGIPVYEVINPVYDDTAVNSDISTLSGRVDATEGDITTLQTDVTNIKTVLDADADGSIIDALADLKTQWESADGDLQTLITGKAEQSVVAGIEGRVTTVETTVAGKAETSTVNGIGDRVTTLETNKADTAALANYRPIATAIIETDLTVELQTKINTAPAGYDDTALAGRVATLEGTIVGKADATSLADYRDKVTAIVETDLSLEVQTKLNATYDDTAILQDIANFKVVLDADSDGSVLDALADIQLQWEAADGDLQGLIANKAETSALENYRLKTTAIAEADLDLATQTKLNATYDDTAIAGRVSTLETDKADKTALADYRAKATAITETDLDTAAQTKLNATYDDTALAGRVSTLEGKALADFTLIDNTTAKIYKLVVDNGVLSVEEIIA